MTAILFLSILVFNFCGYRLVLSGKQTDAAVAIENKVDKKEYNDNELISIKTTLHLPYYTSSSTYERAYGSININGKDYEYVKRRVYNDTLEVLCLPNGDKTKLKSAGNDMAKAAADGQTSAPTKKGATVLKISLPDFCQSIKATTVIGDIVIKGDYLLSATHLLPADYTATLERPPQSMHIS